MTVHIKQEDVVLHTLQMLTCNTISEVKQAMSQGIHVEARHVAFFRHGHALFNDGKLCHLDEADEVTLDMEVNGPSVEVIHSRMLSDWSAGV